jgi:hypothetical protein
MQPAHATCNLRMQHATCACNMQPAHATCNLYIRLQHATSIYACNMQPLYTHAAERQRAVDRKRAAQRAATTLRRRRRQLAACDGYRCAMVQEALAALPTGHILVATDCDKPAGAHPFEYSQGTSSTLSGSEPGTGPASAAALELRGAGGTQAPTNAYSGGFVRYSVRVCRRRGRS